jgi:hypothetical protein
MLSIPNNSEIPLKQIIFYLMIGIKLLTDPSTGGTVHHSSNTVIALR